LDFVRIQLREEKCPERFLRLNIPFPEDELSGE
jgi:hypothetical protein